MNDENLLHILRNRIEEAIGDIRELAVEQLEQKSMDDLTAGRLAIIAYKLESTVDTIRERLARHDRE